jgi:hypothetical protein
MIKEKRRKEKEKKKKEFILSTRTPPLFTPHPSIH